MASEICPGLTLEESLAPSWESELPRYLSVVFPFDVAIFSEAVERSFDLDLCRVSVFEISKTSS